MNVDQDLVGKTITGVIASTERQTEALEIWLLQFSDGSHVEFVSPRARKGLRKTVRQPATGRRAHACESPQLSLSVA